MNNDEKLSLIKRLTELNGLMIVNKIEMNNNSENLLQARKIAKKLSDEGIGDFDFSSDEKFEESLNTFLTEF